MPQVMEAPAIQIEAERRLPWLDALCKRALVQRLNRLQVGALKLIDPEGEQGFGSSDASMEWCVEVEVLRPRFYRRLLHAGTAGAAEAFADGDWTCTDLTALLRLILRNEAVMTALDSGLARWSIACHRLLGWIGHRNSRAGSQKNIRAHYDLGNEFFQGFLDPTMTYSAGIFERPDSTMEEASVAKLERICRKLDLQPGEHLLEIGTGWGSLACHAARYHGCRVTTTTISQEQFRLARQRVAEAGLSDRVTVFLQDYRDLTGCYDKLVSIEMIEAVGDAYLDEWFRRCAALLKPEGMMLIQAITIPDQAYQQHLRNADFIQRHVFPGSCIPSVNRMMQAAARTTDFQLVHLEDLTLHYARTMREWRLRFLQNLDMVRQLGYPDRFLRMWEYYLCYTEAGFAECYLGDVQLLLSRAGCRRRPNLPAWCVPDPGTP